MTGAEAEEAAGRSVSSTNSEVPGVNEVEGVSTVSGGCGAGGRPRRGGCATSIGLETSGLILSQEMVSGLPRRLGTSTTRHLLPWHKILNWPL